MTPANKALRFVLLALTCLSLSARASRKEEVTLIMVPRTEAAVRLGMDVANRYPSLFISYALGANGAVSLHGWTGKQWVNITPEDFAAGNFFRKAPDSVLIVEKENVPVPAKLVPPEEWAPNVSRITTVRPRPLIHLLGQYFDFSYRDWKGFADRYQMGMDAINPEGLNVKWYNRRMADLFGDKNTQEANDLKYWVLVRQAVLAEPETLPEEEETPAPEAEAEVLGNPLTNAVPAAVVLGAPDAPEEQSTPKPEQGE